MKTPQEVTQEWINKNKEGEIKQAKVRALKRLKVLSPEEQKVLALIKQTADRVTMKTVKEMIVLLEVSDAE